MANRNDNFDSPEPRFGRKSSSSPGGAFVGRVDPPGQNGQLEQGTLENVRRFLSDEDEADTWRKSSGRRVPATSTSTKPASLLDETAKQEIKRTSRFRADAGDSSRAFMNSDFSTKGGRSGNLNKKQATEENSRNPSVMSSCGDAVLSFYFKASRPCAVFSEQVTAGWGRSSGKKKLCCLGILVLAVIAIVGTVVAVNGDDSPTYSPPRGGESGEVIPDSPKVENNETIEEESTVDSERFDTILEYLLKSEVSSEKVLRSKSTAQSQALRWLSDKDEAELSVGHFDMLQRYAMATLFFSTTTKSQKWQNDDEWLSSSHVCSWYGVKCGNHVPTTGALQKMSAAVGFTPHIIHLNLTANNLSGELPPELSILAKLKTLAIGANKNLKGSIPTMLGTLHVLALLHLQENQLTGNIPTEIGECTSLRDLHVDSNNLEGNLPTELSLLKSLHSLKVSSNKFSGSIPDVSSFTHLTDLWINDNKFTGEISPELSRATSIEFLHLDQNELSGTIPESLVKLHKLTEFHFYHNNLTGSLPEDICKIPSLRFIGGDCRHEESKKEDPGEIECDCCHVCYH